MVKGECNCGEVAFEADSQPGGVYVCHCSVCRRATGAHGIAIVVVDKANFRWIRGEENIRHWNKPDTDWTMGFCSTCGSPMPGENDEARMFIPAGVISKGTESLEVMAHIYVDSRAHWDVIGDQGRQFSAAYEP